MRANEKTMRRGGSLIAIFFSSLFLVYACAAVPSSHGLENDRDTLRGAWIRVAEHADFTPRDTASGVVFLGKLWISDGFPGLEHDVDPSLIHDLWSSSRGVFWTPVLVEPPYERYSRLVVYQGKLWAINRCGVWYSNSGVDWTRTAKDLGFGGRGYIVIYDNKMWFLGDAEVWSSTDGVEWSCVTDSAPYGRRAVPAIAVFNGKLWVMGGSTPAPGKGYSNSRNKGYPDLDMNNDVWSSTDGANWTRVIAQAPWKGRMWSVAEVYAGHLWILGGYDNEQYANFADAWYTSDGIHWHEFKSEPSWSARHLPVTFVFGQSLWVIGGNSWPAMNDVWKLQVTLEKRPSKP